MSDTDARLLATRSLLALAVVLAGIGFVLAPAAAAPTDTAVDAQGVDLGETVEEIGKETCDTLFGGPHVGYWCQKNAENIADNVP